VLQVWFQNRRAKFRRSERHAFARRYLQQTSDSMTAAGTSMTVHGVQRGTVRGATVLPAVTADSPSAVLLAPGYRGTSATSTTSTDSAGCTDVTTAALQRPQHCTSSASYPVQSTSSPSPGLHHEFTASYLQPPALTHHLMTSY